MFGFVASYARMAWKVANYNALKREADSLRARYQNLQKVVSQTNEQLASLEIYAKEVSVAYGIKQKLEGPSDISSRRQAGAQFRREPAGIQLPAQRRQTGHLPTAARAASAE